MCWLKFEYNNVNSDCHLPNKNIIFSLEQVCDKFLKHLYFPVFIKVGLINLLSTIYSTAVI